MALHDWLPRVIQAVEPYVSWEDIDPGVRWSQDVAAELDNTDFGILCVTHNNVNAPWINFEAGALSKWVDRARVVPFLIDLEPKDIPKDGPLVQFQAVQADKSGVLRIVSSMNELSASLPQERLVETVDMWWPRLDAKLRSIKERPQLAQAAVPQRSPEDMLAELLELTRGLQRGLQTTREVRHPPVMTPSTLYLKELALERFAEIARTHGFQVTFLESSYALNLSNTSSVDLELERAGRKLYVKTTGDINLSQAHEVLRQVRSIGIQDPLILLTLVSVHPDTISQIETELGEHIRVVPRESRLDTFKTALGQLSQS